MSCGATKLMVKLILQPIVSKSFKLKVFKALMDTCRTKLLNINFLVCS